MGTSQTAARPRLVLAHRGLRSFLATRFDRTERGCPEIEFLAPDELLALDGGVTPVIVPAVAEAQCRALAELRDRLPLAPIVAVVNDRTGQQAYRAVCGGASSVLNLTQPRSEQETILRALSTGRPPAGGTVTRLRSVAGGTRQARPEPAADHWPCDGPAVVEDQLVELLRGRSTISVIAARLYCSERSMYRRVRRLYDAFGVSGRAELRDVLTAPAATGPGRLVAVSGE